MPEQTYQEVSKIIMKDLVNLSEEIKDFTNFDFQGYFYKLNQEQPENYQRLRFNKNGSEPFSDTLDSIILDLKICKFFYTPLCVNKNNLESWAQ